MDKQYSKQYTSYCIATSKLIAKQQLKIKSPIVDVNNQLDEIFPSFDSLNKEILLGFWLIDTFSNCFSFFSVNRKQNNLYEDSLINQDTVFIIADVSIINNVATSVSYIQRERDIIVKIVYHATNVNFIEAKLFIRYGINHAMQLQDISCIISVTDAISAAKWIFDISTHLYCYELKCYDLKLKVLSNRTTLVLSNTRELDRVPNTK